MMTGNGCGCSKKICPFSLGLAIGIVCLVGYFLWALWVMYYGMSPRMAAMQMPMPTFEGGMIFISAFWAFVKGLVFGFFVAFFYDLISCCCKSKWCCRKEGHNCACCAMDKKPDALK